MWQRQRDLNAFKALWRATNNNSISSSNNNNTTCAPVRPLPVHALEALVVQPDAMHDGGPRSAPGSDGPGAVPCYRGSCGDEAVVTDALDRLEAHLQEQAQRHASCACADGDTDEGGNKGASVSGAAALP
jgi:hypothetical protein